MLEKKFIADLFDQKAKDDYNSQDLAKVLNVLSKTVFGDVNRFIFELLQNADDSPKNAGAPVEVEFQLSDNYLVFKHTGAHFLQNDIVGISTVGSRKSAKDLDIEKTGYKGIGFKSVFGASDCVQIVSDRYSFRFDRNYELWKDKETFPWQVIPIWTDGVPIETQKYVDQSKVNTIISITDYAKIKKEIIETFKDPEITLFLRNVAAVSFLDKDGNVFKIEKQQTSDNRRKIWLNTKLHSLWILKDFLVPVTQAVKDELSSLPDTICPQRLKDSDNTKITFAAKLSDSRLVPLESAVLYCYLPTQVKKGFPFVVNADFLTNAERTDLLKNEWNEFVFEQIAFKHIEWIAELAVTDLRYQTAKLIKQPFQYSSLKIDTEYNKALSIAIQNTAFIPSNTDNLLLVGNAVTDYTFYTSVFPDSPITKTLLHGKGLVSHGIESPEILNSIGVTKFTIDMLSEQLRQIQYPSIQNAIDETIRLIGFFKDQSERNEAWIGVIKNTCFLLATDNYLRRPSEIYYPTLSQDSAILSLIQLNFLHHDVFAALKSDPVILKWLTSLGLKEPSELEILRNSIFNFIEDNKIQDHLAVDVLKFVFKIFKSGRIQDNDYYYLQKLKIMSVNGLQLPYNCYLQGKYSPTLKIDEILPEANFISDVYLDNEQDLPSWKKFFINIGVKENIKINVNKERQSRNPSIAASPKLKPYFDWIDAQKFYPSVYANWTSQHGVIDFSWVDYLSYTVNYSFSKHFWKIILNSWQEFYDKCFEIKYYHRDGSVPVPSYVRYFVSHNKCIPTTRGTCDLPSEVYSKALANAIGDYFPIVDFDGRITHEQYEFFGIRNSLTIQSCLKLIDSLLTKKDSAEIAAQLFSIYEQLIKNKTELKKGEVLAVKEWKAKGKLVAIDNSFQSVSELYYFSASGIQPPVDSKYFIKLPSDFKHQDIEFLCNVFDIKIISLSDLACNVAGGVSDQSLLNTLNEKAQFLSVIYAHRQSEDVNYVFNKLMLRINSVGFYSCDDLSLKYQVANGATIFESKIETWADKEDCFYYTGKWTSPMTMYSLANSLCEFLGLSDMERELQLILQEDDKTLTKWLIDKGYKVIEPTVQDYNDILPEQDSSVTSKSLPVFDQKIEVEIFKPLVKASDVDISKIKIEHKTAETLVVNKNASTVMIGNDKVKIDVGRWSEEFIYNFLLKNAQPGQQVIWENKDKETYSPYDIRIIDGAKESYIEVKGTPSATKQEIYFSSNEWRLMFEKGENYTIYRLLNVGGREADLKMDIIQNPSSKIKEGLMLPSPIILLV